MKEGEGVKWWKVYDKAVLNEKEICGFKDELRDVVYKELIHMS